MKRKANSDVRGNVGFPAASTPLLFERACNWIWRSKLARALIVAICKPILEAFGPNLVRDSDCLDSCVIFVSSSGKIKGWDHKFGLDLFIPHLFQFIIHYHETFRCCVPLSYWQRRKIYYISIKNKCKAVWPSWYRASLMYSFKYNQQDATSYKIIYCCQCSTCFRRFFRPSSGAQTVYTTSSICQACFLLPLAWVSWHCQLTHASGRQQKSLTNTRCCIYSLSSWWWA
jgi:hypothetical protein